MHKEYKVNFFWSAYPIFTVFGIIMAVGSLYALTRCYNQITPPLSYVALSMPLVSLFMVYLGLFYYSKLEIIVDGDNITHKMPDRTATFNTKDIYKISYGGRSGYYVFYYDEKHKKRRIRIDDYLADKRELIEYLERRSGVETQTFLDGIKNEKRPIIKAIKIIRTIPNL